jgi:hypothetical protein
MKKAGIEALSHDEVEQFQGFALVSSLPDHELAGAALRAKRGYAGEDGLTGMGRQTGRCPVCEKSLKSPAVAMVVVIVLTSG